MKNITIFDDIINKNIPSFIIFENQNIISFLDINPKTLGHTLVVPKRNLENFFDYNSKDYLEVFSAIDKTSKILKQNDPSITGFNIISNNGKDAGQEVMHSHWHLIPRRPNDNINLEQNQSTDIITKEEIEQYFNSIK